MTTTLDEAFFGYWATTEELEAMTRYQKLATFRRLRDNWPSLTHMSVVELTATRLSVLFGDMEKAGYSHETIRKTQSLLAQVIDWCELAPNVARQARRPKGHSHVHELMVPTSDEVAAILAAAEDEGMFTFITLSCALGTRRSELCALRWTDIDQPGGQIYIGRALNPAPGQQGIVKTTKTHQNAWLSVGPKVLDIVQHWQVCSEARATEAGRIWNPHGYVFSHAIHGHLPWPGQYVTDRFAEIRAAAGVGTHVTVKSLRHYHATQLVSHGVDIRTVAGRLRHSNPAMTMQVYARFDKRADVAAAALMDDLI